MLDDLNLPLAALRWKEIVAAPELADFTPYQLFREVLEPQYIETMNNRYKTNLRLSKLIDKSALTENLVTSNKRATTTLWFSNCFLSALPKNG
jgi:hypothetical protein